MKKPMILIGIAMVASLKSEAGVFGNIKVSGNVVYEDGTIIKLKTTKEVIEIPKKCIEIMSVNKKEVEINSSCVLDFAKL